MKARDALRVLAEVAEFQWGMVTSAQARARGVSHMNLTRLAGSGDLVRLNHGVYRSASAPSVEHEELRVAWLAVDPAKLAYERLSIRPPDAVVSGESASKLHHIGDLRAMKSEFTTPTRRQTQRADVRYRARELPEQDVTVWDGLPVTTRERTIADLVEDRQDLSVVGDVLRDAYRQSRLNVARLTELLNPLAERNGHAKGDGAGLLNELRQLAGIDTPSLASRIAKAPDVGALITAAFNAKMPPTEVRALVTAMLEAITDQVRFEDPGRAIAAETTDAIAEMLRTIFASDINRITEAIASYGVTTTNLQLVEPLSKIERASTVSPRPKLERTS